MVPDAQEARRLSRLQADLGRGRYGARHPRDNPLCPSRPSARANPVGLHCDRDEARRDRRWGRACDDRRDFGYPPVLLVRVTATARWQAKLPLDLGVRGVCFPMTMHIRDAQTVPRAVRYPPSGERFWGPFYASMRYGLSPREHQDMRSADGLRLASHSADKRGAPPVTALMRDVWSCYRTLGLPSAAQIQFTSNVFANEGAEDGAQIVTRAAAGSSLNRKRGPRIQELAGAPGQLLFPASQRPLRSRACADNLPVDACLQLGARQSRHHPRGREREG